MSDLFGQSNKNSMGEELLFTAVAQHLLTYKRAPEILIEQMNSTVSQ